jgi:release factor glutamine methyltransferase
MRTEMPESMKKLMALMKERKDREAIESGGIVVDIQPGMFPPKSPFSYSTRSLLQGIEAVETDKKRILELGTGSGIVAIVAARKGAMVDGIDIMPECITCALDNAIRNGVFQSTRFFYSNMFSNVRGKYDLILANLPIFDGDLPENDPMWYSLFDPGFKFHQALFSEGKTFTPQIMITHANLRGDRDFDELESLTAENGWVIENRQDSEYADHTWRSYLFGREA